MRALCPNVLHAGCAPSVRVNHFYLIRQRGLHQVSMAKRADMAARPQPLSLLHPAMSLYYGPGAPCITVQIIF